MRGISLTSSSLSSINLGYPLKGNLLLFYKPLLLEAQHCLQERRGNVDIKHFSGAVAGEVR